MSLNTTDSQQRPTTLSSSTAKRGRCPSWTPSATDRVSSNPEQVGQQYGWVSILTDERRYNANWQEARVFVRCMGCSTEKWIVFANLTRGLSKGCQSCSQPKGDMPEWLLHRLTAAKQRCENPNAPEWANYGGRGLKFEFTSVSAAAQWVIENLSPLQRDKDIDRADNTRGYAPGNLRWATRSENNCNKRTSTQGISWAFEATKWPYSENQVRRRLREGMTREQILADAHLAVVEKRKNWRGIKERLELMTS